MQNLSDYELMLLIKGKQHTALSVLYDRYAGLIYSFAWKASGMNRQQEISCKLYSCGSGRPSPITIRARAGSPAGCSR